MSPKLVKIATEFMNLADSEKAELIQFLRLGPSGPGGLGGPGRGGRIVNEEFGKSETINFAPGPKVCPRCGR